ncbi:hypothetical protein N9B73_00380 [Verrucomicrobiales bacterium]|nr:hypothetical protein [Verrucomicrobiales bacterium]
MSEDEQPKSESGMPDGIPAPPPPKPDVVDPSADQPSYSGSKSADKKKKKARKHPSDPYEPLKKRKGCCGCILGLGVMAVILLGALTAALYFAGPGRYIANEAYEPVTLSFTEPTTISEAPTKATMYMGNDITYSAPTTNVPIAIFGVQFSVSGNFTEDVSLTGAKVTGTAAARFAKDLEVFAAEFYDKGIFLKGDLTGRVMKSLQ